jgi:hypothetical protein
MRDLFRLIGWTVLICFGRGQRSRLGHCGSKLTFCGGLLLRDRWSLSVVSEDLRCAGDGWAGALRGMILNVDSDKPANLPEHPGWDFHMASVVNELIREVENDRGDRCCRGLAWASPLV